MRTTEDWEAWLQTVRFPIHENKVSHSLTGRQMTSRPAQKYTPGLYIVYDETADKEPTRYHRAHPNTLLIPAPKPRLMSRTKPIFAGFQSPVSYLPLDQHSFKRLVGCFHIHPRVIRTIGRQICGFSTQTHRISIRNCDLGSSERESRARESKNRKRLCGEQDVENWEDSRPKIAKSAATSIISEL
jgi:hypothetical protein